MDTAPAAQRLIQDPVRLGDAGALQVLAVFFVLAVAPLWPPLWQGVSCGLLAIMTVVAFTLRCTPAFHLAFLGALTLALGLVPALQSTWPVPLLLVIGVHIVAVRFTPRLRGSLEYLRPGRLGLLEMALGLLFVLISSVALLGWYHLMQPSLDDLLERLPAWPLPLLALLGLVFAMANAFAEEVLFRGAMLHGLDAALGRGRMALLLQAMAFGLWHIQGFPRGWAGVGLATVYGLMMGGIRRSGRGLLAAWVAHVCADLTIFAILVLLAR